MQSPKRNTAPFLAALCLFLFAAAAITYFKGYFALSSSQVTERGRLLRVYSSELEAEVFSPLACLEEAACGRRILVGWRRR